MADAVKKFNRRHVELAQKVLDVATESGMTPGERLAEQALATLCKVSRTPIRKALQVLAARGVVVADADGGYRFAADPILIARLNAGQDERQDDDLHDAILRDLAAGRISPAQTAIALQRRYGAARQAVQNALMELAEDGLAARGGGQQWLLKQFAVSPDAAAKSDEFRLASEPLALTLPDFQCDPTAMLSLRQSMIALQAMGEADFDRHLFDRTDMDFHMLIARSCGNPFLAEALLSHHRRRFALPQSGHVGVYRLMQSNGEHLQILEQIERGQMALAADLMRVHIQLSGVRRPRLAGRGVPPAFKRIAH